MKEIQSLEDLRSVLRRPKYGFKVGNYATNEIRSNDSDVIRSHVGAVGAAVAAVGTIGTAAASNNASLVCTFALSLLGYGAILIKDSTTWQNFKLTQASVDGTIGKAPGCRGKGGRGGIGGEFTVF
ncbi:unnamed protein product [Phytophthora lilii]|uniref:Unnamed protein product n=1 Tax=Phytophthora lilii TaxID=2077276 RepID=A0A9W6TGR6_9STRA|nr:unnamed protein product [Phytophthora lilii]